MAEYYLAFDLGASSGRAILGSFSGERIELEEIHRFSNGPIEKNGTLFWDFEALSREIKTGLKKAAATGKPITGIGIDTWGVDYVLLKKNEGTLARNPYHYRDSRTDNMPEKVYQTVPKQELYSRTGLQEMQLNTIFQLCIHKQQHPEDLTGSVMLLMPDALTWMLTGKASVEYSDASTTSLLNAQKRDWDYELIDKLGLPRGLFLPIVMPGTKAGTLSESVQKEVGCGPIPVFHVGSHDTASAVASVPVEGSDSWAYISCGTWALLGAELDSPILTPEAMAASFTNEGGVGGKIRFLSNIMGMWLLQECRRTWKERGIHYTFDQMADMAKNAKPLRFLINPNNNKFFAPCDMPKKIREYCRETGQGEPENDGAVLRCIYDSLAVCFRKKLEKLGELLGKPIRKLHIVGGGTQDSLLMQYTADSTGIPVISGPVEATAIGNIAVQAMAGGTIQDLAHARKIVRNSFPILEFKPSVTDRALWDAAIKQFANLS